MSEAVKVQEEQTEQEERFVVDNDQKAAWCMEKIREAQEDTEEWKAHFASQLAKIEAANQETINRMTFMLQEYFQTVPHKKAATQESYPLKGGKLVLKRQQPEYEHDDEKLVPWLKANRPELVKVKESSDWAELKKHCTYFDGQVVDSETCEVIPGVTATPRPSKFGVEFKKGGEKQ